MIFYPGLHHIADAARLPRAFLSVHTLARRRSKFAAGDWICDSGAFTTIMTHGGYPQPVESYARTLAKFAGCGRLIVAVAQDYMCEPAALERTGMTIAEHQRLTIERYDQLHAIASVPILAVLQGYEPANYVAHLRAYGGRLESGAYVGVGSLCKRNGSPAAIEMVLRAILAERPDLRLHGFGVKTTALTDARVRDRLYSADSMAWSFAARYERRNGNDWREAKRFMDRIENGAVQTAFNV